MDDSTLFSHIPRRKFLQLCVGSSLMIPIRHSVFANPTEDCRLLIEESLDSLASIQNTDGSYGKKTELFGQDPATSALAGLAFMASGSLPGRGKYGPHLTKIVDYLLKCSLLIDENNKPIWKQENLQDSVIRNFLITNNISPENIKGLIANLNEKGLKPLYGHGYATLFLAEVFGAQSYDDLDINKAKIQTAIDLIIKTQNTEGGWRYFPQCVSAADISVTTCLLSALRACQKAGFFVPQNTIRDAIDFICRLQNNDGGFRYMTTPGPSSYARTAAAIHVLQICESNHKVEIAKGIQYLKSVYLEENTSSKSFTIDYWTYAQFYSSLVFQREYAQINDVLWNNFKNKVITDLLKRRSPNGLWSSTISKEVETAFALCTLLTLSEGIPLFLC